MKDAEVRLELENTTLTYFPGQDICGNVHVIARKKIKPRMIKVELTGKMYTSFTQGGGDDSTTYTAEKTFMSEHLHVWEPNRNGASNSLAPGEYRFPFAFRLPPNLEYPPPFTGLYGYIRYKVDTNIDLVWQSDPKAEVHIAVVGLYNVSDPKYLLPVEGHDSKVLGCLCCASPPITCKVTCAIGGALPGDVIKPVITISNPSNTTIRSVKLLFRQCVDYRAGRALDPFVNDFNLHDFPSPIAAGTQSLTLAKDVTVPAGLPPSFTSDIITISYKIIAVLMMPGMSRNLNTGALLFIGNSRVITNSDGISPRVAHQQGQPYTSHPQEQTNWYLIQPYQQ